MIDILAWIVAGVAAMYVGWLVVLWHFQERVVFQPPRVLPEDAVSARRVSFTASDGVELFGYVLGDCDGANTTLLAFHGNADLARRLVPWATDTAANTGACVVVPEYRGYDGLLGKPTYSGSARDAQAALDYCLNELGASPANMVYFGHSLGTAIATELAANAPPRALVLQSPFSSARAMARRMVIPGITRVWSFISRVHFDTVGLVRSLSCPVWVVHGDHDLVVPVEMGREVFAAAAHQGELLIVAGAGHSDVAEYGNGRYWKWLRDALTPRLTNRTGHAARAETPLAP